MNLRRMSNTGFKLILVQVILLFIFACGSGSDSEKNSGAGQGDIAQSHDGRDGDRDCDRRDSCDDDHRPGGGTTGSVNIIATHNPRSSQYNDNCLQCHGDIPNAQSLNSNIPNAHVAMLAFTPGNNGSQCVWCHRDISPNLVLTASASGPFQTNIRKHVDTQLCSICHGPVGPGKRFYQTGLTTTENLDGGQLYHYLCSACHRELANSEVRGESAQEIYGAIAKNEGGMGPLSVLNPQWVQAIAVALGGDPTLPPNLPAPGTGAALYQQYCSGCHGDLANSTKAGASADQIQTAITNDTGGMGQFSFLTSAQIQAIADALSGGGGGGGGGTDGAALYQQYCSGCHGDLANSSKAGASANLIQTAITNDTGGMRQFSFLTSAQIQAIADALSGGGGGGGGTDGVALYQQYCSSCHGDLANSSQAGASANLIQTAISNDRGGMGQFSFLSSAQIQAIANALSGSGGGGGGGGGGGTDGEALYQYYCSSCHRALSDSQVSGESADEIEAAISDDKGGMGSLEFLSSEQISAIAEALHD